MACVLVGEAFAQKYVAKVPIAVLAKDLDAATVGIGFTADGAFDFVVETWPTTARMKLAEDS